MGFINNKRGNYKPKKEHIEKLRIFLKKISNGKIR